MGFSNLYNLNAKALAEQIIGSSSSKQWTESWQNYWNDFGSQWTPSRLLLPYALTVSECLHNPRSICPLTEERNLGLDHLFNQLEIAKNLIQKRKIETVEMSLTVLTTKLP